MQMRLLSAMPSAMAQRVASVTSSCMAAPHCFAPAWLNSRPELAEPRKLTCNTAYPAAALIEYADGATVRQQHQRLIAPIAARRQGQEAVQRQSVARLQRERPHGGGQFRVDPFAAAEQMLGRLCAG